MTSLIESYYQNCQSASQEEVRDSPESSDDNHDDIVIVSDDEDDKETPDSTSTSFSVCVVQLILNHAARYKRFLQLYLNILDGFLWKDTF